MSRAQNNVERLFVSDEVSLVDQLSTLSLLHSFNQASWISSQSAISTELMQIFEHPVVSGIRMNIEDCCLRTADQEASGIFSRISWKDCTATVGERMTLLAQTVDKYPPIYKYLLKHGTRTELDMFLKMEGGPDHNFQDLAAVAMVGLDFCPSAKLEIAKNLWDEMGQGEPSQTHEHLYKLHASAPLHPSEHVLELTYTN
eukprot:ANDGO_04749.mRNA.1 hypothetical protein